VSPASIPGALLPMPERFFVLLVFIVRLLDQNLFEKKHNFSSFSNIKFSSLDCKIKALLWQMYFEKN
jgi:hypothetical protein